MTERPTTICPGCGDGDPEMVTVDFGIGAYEYAGAPGFHRNFQTVTRCCEAPEEEFWPEPVSDEEATVPVLQVGSRVRLRNYPDSASHSIIEITREGGTTHYMIELGDAQLGFLRSEIEPVA